MNSQKKHITTVYLDRQLWKRARKVAVDRDVSFSNVMEGALREWLDQQKQRRGNAAA